MTKSIRTYFAIFVIVQCIISNRIQSQSLDDVVDFGDLLFKQENYYAAINEYQRAFFFSAINRKAELGIKIASSYLILNEIEKSQLFYDSAFYYAKNDSIKTKCILGKIAGYIMEEDFGYALLKLFDLEKNSIEYFNFERELYKGISLFGLENYDAAFHTFGNIIYTLDSSKTSSLKNLSDNRENLLRPNPTIATALSIIAPGTGQIYSGKFFEGLNSVALLGGLVYLSLNNPINFLLSGPFIYRYYVGGIVNANRYAKKRRKAKQSDYYNELMIIFNNTEYLQQLFIEQKPLHFHDEYLASSINESKLVLSFLFLFYKGFFSSQDIDACVFYPSCSTYAIGSIEKRGFLIGLLEGLDRLLRCHSFVNKNEYPFIEVSKKYYDPI